MSQTSSNLSSPSARTLSTDEAERLASSIRTWAAPENRSMQKALKAAVARSPYHPDDIRDQLEAVRGSLSPGALTRWIEAVSERVRPSGPGRVPVVLGLQAGNLALAGVQDVVAALLAGCVYVGKRSRREPWLSGSLLEHLAADGFAVAAHAVSVRDLAAAVREKTGSAADAVLFSGSAESVPSVRENLIQAGLHAPGSTRELIRTAHLSIAWLTRPLAPPQPPVETAHPPGEPANRTADELIRSILAHGNRGCRSTAVVVSPDSLAAAAPALRDAASRFHAGRELRKGDEDGQTDERILVELACDKALGIECLDLGGVLVTCRTGLPEQPGIVHWMRGGAREFAGIMTQAEKAVQSVYMAAQPGSLRELLAGHSPSQDATQQWIRRVEPLAAAQAPPVSWRPDGVDPLEWLLANFRTPPDG